MIKIATLTRTGDAVERFDEIPQEMYDAWVAASNPKLQRKRLVSMGTPPTPSPTQRVVHTGWSIGETVVTATYQLVDKTTEELDEDADAVERQQVAALVTAMRNGTGTATERLARVERVLVFVLKRMLKGGL